jgi:hypothetical protein
MDHFRALERMLLSHAVIPNKLSLDFLPLPLRYPYDGNQNKPNFNKQTDLKVPGSRATPPNWHSWYNSSSSGVKFLLLLISCTLFVWKVLPGIFAYLCKQTQILHSHLVLCASHKNSQHLYLVLLLYLPFTFDHNVKISRLYIAKHKRINTYWQPY